MYILKTKYEMLYEFDTIEDVADYFHICTNIRGEVYFNGLMDTITYNISEYTQEEVIKDFIRTRLLKLINNAGYTIYKCEKLNG